MALKPIPGLVIRYSYLGLSDHHKGQEEGVPAPNINRTGACCGHSDR